MHWHVYYNMECTSTNEYRCNTCNKIYSSRQSLWNHNKKFHLNIVPETIKTPPDSAKTPPESAKNTSENNNIICEYCKTTFTRNDSLKKHHTRCKIKLNSDNKLKEENEKLKNEMELFKTILNRISYLKIHNSTILFYLTHFTRKRDINSKKLIAAIF